MATINLGSIKFNWRGVYNNSTAYAVDDVVSSGGRSYICILASTGNAVTNTTYWNVMSQGGTDVGTTLTTQGDILYRDGSGLQRLAAGTSGQFLKTQGTGANPTWGSVTSAILQMKSTSFGDTFSTNTNTWNGLSATEFTPATLTITPTSASSVLKIDCTFPVQHDGDYCGSYWLSYNHSGISETVVENDHQYGATWNFDRGSNTDSNMGTGIAVTIFLSLNTTNAVTIKHRFAGHNSSHYVRMNRTDNADGVNDSFRSVGTVVITELDGSVISHTKGNNINGD